jgi:hypothetical protein
VELIQRMVRTSTRWPGPIEERAFHLALSVEPNQLVLRKSKREGTAPAGRPLRGVAFRDDEDALVARLEALRRELHQAELRQAHCVR